MHIPPSRCAFRARHPLAAQLRHVQDTLLREYRTLAAFLLERKPSTQRHFGGNKQRSRFLATDGVSLVLHCNHRTQQPGDDGCSEGLIPAKAVHLRTEEVKKLDEVLAIDPGRQTIATAWLPSSEAFFLDRNVHYKLSGVNKAENTTKERTHRHNSNWTTPATTQEKQAVSTKLRGLQQRTQAGKVLFACVK